MSGCLPQTCAEVRLLRVPFTPILKRYDWRMAWMSRVSKLPRNPLKEPNLRSVRWLSFAKELLRRSNGGTTNSTLSYLSNPVLPINIPKNPTDLPLNLFPFSPFFTSTRFRIPVAQLMRPCCGQPLPSINRIQIRPASASGSSFWSSPDRSVQNDFNGWSSTYPPPPEIRVENSRPY